VLTKPKKKQEYGPVMISDGYDEDKPEVNHEGSYSDDFKLFKDMSTDDLLAELDCSIVYLNRLPVCALFGNAGVVI